jgi:beta-N-acetylhexosaminidase
LLTTLLPGFKGTTLPIWLRNRLRAGLGGVCLFAQNISSPAQLRALTDSIMTENPYAIIAVDEEGGDVTRLWAATGAPFPGNAVLGRLDHLDTTRDTAATIGWLLRQAAARSTSHPASTSTPGPTIRLSVSEALGATRDAWRAMERPG